MNLNSYLLIVRQYNALSMRKHVNYNRVIDELTATFEAQLSEDGHFGYPTKEQLAEITAREYPERLRDLPPSRQQK